MLSATFDTRREAEMTVERLVQQFEMDRTAIFITAEGNENSAGEEKAGSDTEAGEPSAEARDDAPLNGAVSLRSMSPTRGRRRRSGTPLASSTLPASSRPIRRRMTDVGSPTGYAGEPFFTCRYSASGLQALDHVEVRGDVRDQVGRERFQRRRVAGGGVGLEGVERLLVTGRLLGDVGLVERRPVQRL